MSKAFKRIALLLIVTMIAPMMISLLPSVKSLTVAEVSAAEAKAKIGNKAATIAIQGSPEFIRIENGTSTDNYTYSSANKKIATVTEDGVIRGVAKGKTKIKVSVENEGTKKDVGTLSVNVVNSKLESKGLEVGLNSYGDVPITYMNWDAQYTYKSSNSKIVSVDEYGNLEGKKLGKTKVSVTETYKGEKRKLGSYTVNVINSKLSKKETEVGVTGSTVGEFFIFGYNSKAKYSYKSSDKKIVTVDEYGYITGVKEGSAKVTISETYNKKTRNVGSLKVKVVGSSIDKDYNKVEMGVTHQTPLTDLVFINNCNHGAEYTCTFEDESIVSGDYIEEQEGYKYFNIIGKEVGSSKITVYVDYKGVKKKVGDVTVTVKEYPVTDLELYPYYFDTIDDKLTNIYYLGEDYTDNSLKYTVDVEPYNTTTPITYSSSDETVITVNEAGIVTPIMEGTATITITCGSFSISFEASVKSDVDTDIYDEEW